MSAASAASHPALTSPASESISSDEPTLTTMRRKFFRSGRAMAAVVMRLSQNAVPATPHSEGGAEATNRSLSTHNEGVELVAFRIPEIRSVTAFSPRSRRAFVGAAERQRKLVDAIDLRLVLGGQRDHHAIADRHRFAVERLCQPETGSASGRTPGDKAVGLHETSDTHLGGNLVVELGCFFQIVGAQSDVTDHVCPLSFRMV